MPAPHPIELRERAVRAYERSGESILVVAARFGVAPAALQRWLRRKREADTVAPRERGGGNPSPIDVAVLTALVVELRDATTYELTAAYNRRVSKARAVHRSSEHPPCVGPDTCSEKCLRPFEQSRPDVRMKRARFIRRIKRVGAERLVCLSMNREPISRWAGRMRGFRAARNRSRGVRWIMNWGKNFTMIGAIRQSGWVTPFAAWVRRRLAPKLRVGDVVILDNAQAHKSERVVALIEARGARVEFLPPY